MPIMKKNVFLCLILIFSVFTTNLPAAETESNVITELSGQELQLHLQLTHLMMETAESLDRKLPEDKNPFENTSALQVAIKEEVMKFERFYEKTGMIPDEKIPAFRKFISLVKWDNLIVLMKRAHIGVEVFFKRKGYGIALSLMLGRVIEASMAYFCVHHNLQPLLPFVMAAPWGVLAASIPVKLQKMKIESQIKETLGGDEQLKAFKAQQDKMLEVMGLASEKDFVLPLEMLDEGTTNAVVIKHSTPWNHFLNFFGLKQDELTLMNLKSFLKDNNIDSGYIKWLLKNKNLDETAKLALITHTLFNNEDVREKFQLRFSSKFKTFSANKNWNDLVQWTQKMKGITEVDDLIVAFKNLPSSLSPKEAALIWNEVLFPQYLEHLNLNFEEGRNLVLQSDSLGARLSMLPANATSEDIQREFLTGLSQMLSDTPGKRCQVPAALIGERLLQSL